MSLSRSFFKRNGFGLIAVAAMILLAASTDAASPDSSIANRSPAGNNVETGGRFLLDPGWEFTLKDIPFNFLKAGPSEARNGMDFKAIVWRRVDLPHDWAVELGFGDDTCLGVGDNGYKRLGWTFPENSIGWYRKSFPVSKEDLGRRLFIQFDGVFRDCKVWLNGLYLGGNESGYLGFRFDVTDLAHYGGTNVLTVRVNATSNEGWWYEGAGIYRHVWLIKKPPAYIPETGTYVTTEVQNDSARVVVQTDLVNKGYEAKDCRLELKVLDGGGKTVGQTGMPVRLEADTLKTVCQQMEVPHPVLWSPDSPYVYKLISVLNEKGVTEDRTETVLGIRTVTFDARWGLLLNGAPLKIKGVCVHQDHAGVGVALPDRLQAYRIERLKELGCNAYRTSHNPPSPELLDACDRLGMLVIDETRMLTSSSEYTGQFERFILRDRNHPSVIIWSIGNEEHDIQDNAVGKRIAQTFKRIQRKLDPSRLCTYAGNNRGQFEGVNEVVDVRGFNYFGRREGTVRVYDIDRYHRNHPEQPVWGTEEASTLCTRGQYAVDKVRGYMSDYDKLENVHYSWCANAEEWWKFYSEREWLAGGFIWTGFDYRGETGPFNWPTVSSHFGVMDLCGFPKNNYFYYQAWWTDRDVLHLFPHWNRTGKTGETVNVWCQTNCERVELFLNGKSLGSKIVETKSHVEWDVIYEPGILEARGIRNKRTLSTKVETTGPAARLVLLPDRTVLRADGEDVCVLTVIAVDEQGREVTDAANLIAFEIEGCGKIIGVGNGDPCSHEPDVFLQGDWQRRLFNGKAQVLVRCTREAGPLRLTARSKELRETTCTANVVPTAPRPSL